MAGIDIYGSRDDGNGAPDRRPTCRDCGRLLDEGECPRCASPLRALARPPEPNRERAYAQLMASALDVQARGYDLRAIADAYDDAPAERRELSAAHHRRLARECRETAAVWRRLAAGGTP